MISFVSVPKLHHGDHVAILSPAFAASGVWPHVHELGLQRLRKLFALEPIEYPTTRQVSASPEDRARDLIAAFSDPNIRAIITTIGGDDEVLYAKKLPQELFSIHPKPFFGYSDNTHIINHLWLCGVPAYYGGSLFTQFAMQGAMDDFTVRYLRQALFGSGEIELTASDNYNDIGLSWDDPSTLVKRRVYEPNEGWYWDGTGEVTAITWGGCLESIDEMLRHDVPLPPLNSFAEIILVVETSEEMPSAAYVARVYRALGERGLLSRLRGVLVGRPKAWEFDHPQTTAQKKEYRAAQREVTVDAIRRYNPTIPIVQNLDFGHTDPQICLPIGMPVRINTLTRQIFAQF